MDNTKRYKRYNSAYAVCATGNEDAVLFFCNTMGVHLYDTPRCKVLATDNYWEAYGYAAKMSKELGCGIEVFRR